MNETLAELVALYETTLLRPEFRERIRQRERHGRFPFSRQNIYRVLHAVAVPLAQALSRVSTRLDLESPRGQTLLGHPGRVLRYFHVALVGTYLADGTSQSAALEALPSLARAVATRIAAQMAVPEAVVASALRTLEVSDAGRHALRLAVTLREHIDLSFLGQHDHAYRSFPPVALDRGLLIVRQFCELPEALIGVRELDVLSLYRREGSAEALFDRFRGDVEQLPAPDLLLRGAARAGSRRRPLSTEEIATITARAEGHLAGGTAGFGRLTGLAAEQRVATLFLRELISMMVQAGLDPHPIEAQTQERLLRFWSEDGERYLLEDGRFASLTDAYMGRLHRAIAWLRSECWQAA